MARNYLKVARLLMKRARHSPGYAPDSWDALSSTFGKKGAQQETIDRSGLVRKRKRVALTIDFRSRLVIRDGIQGKPIAFGDDAQG